MGNKRFEIEGWQIYLRSYEKLLEEGIGDG